MKLSSQAVEQALNQFEAECLPETHPAVQQLNQLFGEHTYFLDGEGLHIVEPTDMTASGGGSTSSGAQTAMLVKLASWSDSSRTSLAPHSPEPTDRIIVLEAA